MPEEPMSVAQLKDYLLETVNGVYALYIQQQYSQVDPYLEERAIAIITNMLGAE